MASSKYHDFICALTGYAAKCDKHRIIISRASEFQETVCTSYACEGNMGYP